MLEDSAIYDVKTAVLLKNVPGLPPHHFGKKPMEIEELRNAGLKSTSPRLKILELLENAKKKHRDAETIYGSC